MPSEPSVDDINGHRYTIFMKYLLTSAGFTTEEIVITCENLVNKNRQDISVGIINEAYAVEQGDKRWMINELSSIANKFGGAVDIVNLLSLSDINQQGRIEACDMIYVVGGNTDYLNSVYRSSGFDSILTKLREDMVYVGSSAGGMVLGKRLPSKARAVLYDEQQEFGTDGYLEIFDFALVPHMNSEVFQNCTQDIVCDELQGFDEVAYCLNDAQAIAIDGGDISFIGGVPLIIRNGEAINP